MSRYFNPKHPEWFRKWQQKFYNSKQWRSLRDEVRRERGMRCEECGKLIIGKSICDHINEITPDNYQDEFITLNKNNIRLMDMDCHNRKTFSSPLKFDTSNRKDVNLF